MARTVHDNNLEDTMVIHFLVNGRVYQALKGDTIASALYAAGVRAWRRSHTGDLRGLFCGIGHCFDCLVTVNGVQNVRACQTLVEQDMEVLTNLRDKE